MGRFTGKVVLITGGSQGIGLETAIRFAQEGAYICITGRNLEKGEIAINKINMNTNHAYFIQCDINIESEVINMIQQCIIYFGTIDIAFNNAGVTSEYALLPDSNTKLWHQVINTNICGTYHCMKYELQAMEKNGGVIINNASCVGLIPIPKQSAYVASKHAIIGLTKSVAIDYAEGDNNNAHIRINAIAPGPIEGGMNFNADSKNIQRKKSFTAMNRLGKPEEVAKTVLWLSSDDASYITGSIISIDGGMSAGKWS